MTFVALGSFDCPSGVLLVVDLGLAHHWERRGLPAKRREETLYDVAFEGPDAREAGLRYDRGYDPLRQYDLRDAGRAVERFAAFTREERLDARAVVLPTQVPHAERVRRALSARASGIGCFTYDRLWGVAVGGIPTDRALPVVGVPMPPGEFAGRFRSIDVVIDADAVVAATQEVTGVMVDHGQLACVDLEVMDSFHAMRSLDGLADYVFWGPAAPELADRLGATKLDEREYGWRDLSVDEVGRYAQPVQAAIESGQLRAAVDYRPHCHVDEINRQIRRGPSRSGEAVVAGRRVCGFDNRWGDGVFGVLRDLDADGRVVRVRMDVGSEAVQRRMRRVAHRWQRALVTRAVLDDAEPARFVDRYAPRRRDDSGWVVSAGVEPEDAPGFVALPVPELTARYPELTPLLDAEVGARFRLVADGRYEREE